MKKVCFTFILTLTLLCSYTGVYCQKYGHVKLGNLLTKMPAIEESSEGLLTYQEQLQAALQIKIDKWEQKVVDLQKQAQEVTPKELKARESQLLEEQQEILQEEQQLNNKILEKRNAIMGPIIAKAQSAINEVGQENGYTMIFDTSIPNLVLYVEESDDLMTKVLAKLGIKEE